MTVGAPARDTVRTAPPQDAGVWTQLRVLTGRSLRALVLDPRLVVASMLGPLLMLGTFSQLFGSVARAPGFPPGVRYVDFLVPAIMVTSAMQAAPSRKMKSASRGVIQPWRSGSAL